MTSFIIAADTLSDALDPVTALVDECKFQLNSDGLSIMAVDPANVGMVDLEVEAGAFESYQADGATLGINLEQFCEVLGMADSGDLIHCKLNPETFKLDIEIAELSYTLALIDPESIRQEPDIPDLDLDATVVLEGEQISRGITAADLCSEHATFQAAADEKTFNIKAQGDTDDVCVTFDEDELLSAQVAESCQSMFSLDYLKDMERAILSDTEVSLVLGSEFPVKMRYSFDDGRVSVVNMLAPRIESE